MHEILARYRAGERYFAGANLAHADLAGANLAGANLAHADLAGANLAGADLAGAYLAGAYLARAYLARANLAGANLAGADLAGANLDGANLARVNLARINLGKQWVIQGACRSDGYWFSLQKLIGGSEPMVRAGCRYFTLPQARDHWQSTRGGTALGAETFAILDCLEAQAKARNLL